MSAPPSSMFSVFLDVCTNFIDYIRKLWISRGGGNDRNSRGNSQLCEYLVHALLSFTIKTSCSEIQL